MDWKTAKPFINRWRHMMDRCYDPDHPMYPNYGGRGITVCDEWHNFFIYAAELPDGFFKGAHLDRIDNNGDYRKDNVRWLTARDNHNNRRKHVLIEHEGRVQTLAQWARELEINVGTLTTRLKDCGWSVQKAFETPPLNAHERMQIARNKRLDGHVKKLKLPVTERRWRRVVYQGQEFTIPALSKVCGVSSKLLYKRIFERRWPVERAASMKGESR